MTTLKYFNQILITQLCLFPKKLLLKTILKEKKILVTKTFYLN